MDNILRDPVWQFIGALLGLLAILISVWIFFAQRKNKMLVYDILSDSSILSTTDQISGKLKILFQNKPVKNVSLVVIRVINSGNVPITSKDYERNVRFIFNKDVKILTAEVAETQPESLGAEISIVEKNIIALEPVLLNGGDTVTVKALISEYSKGLKVDGRIVGVKEIKKQTEGTETITTFIFLVASMTAGVSAGILEISNGHFDLWKIHNPISQILMFVAYILLFVAVFINRNFRKFLKNFRKI